MPDNHVLLETIELTQTASSVVFDLIPQTGYTDLKLIISARSTRGTYAEDGLGIRLNSSTTGYTYKILGGNGGGLYNLDTSYEQTWVCNIPASTATSGVFGSAEAYIPNYTSSFAKSYSVEGNAENNSSTGYMTMGAILQASTSPITSITLLAQNGNLLAGSTFSLYGIAAAEITPAIAPKATGGNIVANDGTYWYHAFLTSGTFTPQTALSCNYLVIGGGGSAGRYGGGGAGGYRTAAENLTVSNYTVLVGAGGASHYANFQGNNGTSSTFSSITSAGGGGGGSVGGSVGVGLAGASGGGGGSDGVYAGGAGNTPATSPAQGFAGSAGGASHPNYFGGGGGGATGVGTTGSGSTGGSGGPGSNAHSTWASATNTGVSGYYAGGGGGVGYAYPGTGTPGVGGAGGGGTASNIGDGSGTPNAGVRGTGGGGGAGFRSDNTGSNAGGSGIIIIRYAMV
jgi:hypothetical protein